MDSFQWMDATTLAELIKNKQVKPEELVDSTINRIEKLNPSINAIVSNLYEDARETASRNDLTGPFSGVPFLMKDLEFFAGTKYSAGSKFLENFIAPVDSELSSRIRKAGLITVGKTNTCEMGILPVTEPALFGPTRNPWNTQYTAGGSSGGAAAAVAAGIVPMAHASDGGGSIRIPASCCGVFGLKISRGRNPRNPDPTGLAVTHCVSRSVRDSAALLDATSGSKIGDPYYLQRPKSQFIDEVGMNPRQLRIAFLTTGFDGSSVHEDCFHAVTDATRLCEDLGHHVEEASPLIDVPAFTKAFTTLWHQMLALGISSISNVIGRKPSADYFEPWTWEIAQRGASISGTEYLTSLSYIQRVGRDVAEFMSKYDVFLTPTLASPPVKIGEFDYKGDYEDQTKRINEWVPFTPLANATGIPAMSVPLNWNSDGLPIGVQFFGRFGDEATLLRLAGQLEQARPWANRHPVTI